MSSLVTARISMRVVADLKMLRYTLVHEQLDVAISSHLVTACLLCSPCSLSACNVAVITPDIG